MPNCPIHLHDLLVRLLELEDEARKELKQQAHSVAVARVLERGKLSSGYKLSKKKQTFLKAVQEGERRINEVYRSDPARQPPSNGPRRFIRRFPGSRH